MAETTITALTNASTLDGTERVPMDQAGITVDASTLAIAQTLPNATTDVAGKMTAADKTKLDGVATGATVNSSDATLLARANHTGTQAANTITGLGTAATANTGTAAGNVVVLDGSARLPAVDGSLLTGLVAATDLTYTAATRVVASSTGTDATLTLVTSTDAGLVPATGGGTTNFLRADGTFAAPPGGTPGGSDTQIQFNDDGAFAGDADLTWNKTTNVLGVTGDVNLSDGGTYTTTLQTITPTAARTISFPDATGTVGLVGGSSGNLVVNQSGAYAGVANSSVDNATGNITLGSRFISSLNGAASAPPGTFTGTWFTGGTATTTKPQVLIEPTGATSTAWSTSGTGFGINAASGFAGRLLDLQLNGTSNFSVSSAGQALVPNGTLSNPSYGFSANPDCGFYIRSTNQVGTVVDGVLKHETTAAGFDLSNTPIRFSSNVAAAGADVGLFRSAAGVVKVTNGSTGDGTISGQLRSVGTAPASATATGTAGDIRYDADYIYICTATNTWKRAAVSTW